MASSKELELSESVDLLLILQGKKDMTTTITTTNKQANKQKQN